MSIIYGERVRLRATEREDVNNFYAWVNDPDVTRYLSLYLPMSTVDEENWFNSMTQRSQSEKTLVIEVRDGNGWKMIGNCGVFDIDTIGRLGEIGIMLGEKDEWDKGYGTEAMSLLVRHCFETLNFNRVYLRVYAENLRAKRAYEKAGFVEEGRLREAVYKNGKYDDVIIMSVLRAEWIAQMKEK
ncbi:MAG: GNAT family N-acetyltransferase [Anaerolineales bacterium]|uniref:GNAT family N-acetyltransferase n=1 Tax=Candidatus Villigracilis proximus TaxID=3140683 RepID=UPI0031363B4C|nr:GNAT family N-acetyltransferase [Anaerolineales bacterium]